MTYSLNTNALTELAAVKDELGITVSTYDQTLIRMINSVSDYVERFVGRKLYWGEDIVEKQAGYGTRYMVLNRRPVSSITSITLNGGTVSSDAYEIHDADAGILFALGNWTWTAGLVGYITEDPWPGTERKLYTVTYDAGYVLPGQVGGTLTRTLPYDIEDAVIRLVAARFLSKGQRFDVEQESLMSWSAKYGSSSTAEESLREVLMSYKELM